MFSFVCQYHTSEWLNWLGVCTSQEISCEHCLQNELVKWGIKPTQQSAALSDVCLMAAESADRRADCVSASSHSRQQDRLARCCQWRRNTTLLLPSQSYHWQGPLITAVFLVCLFKSAHIPAPVCTASAAVTQTECLTRLQCENAKPAGSGCTNGGTAAAAPPPFRPNDPALCGSRPLVTPYYCRLGDLLCLFCVYHFVRHYCLWICVFSCFRCFLSPL